MPKITNLPPALAGLNGVAKGPQTPAPKPAKGPKGKGSGPLTGVKKIPLPGKTRGR
ncbi:MAG: hypothetical protein ACRCS3_13275 [Paracoccaceae bacterium]